MINKTRLAHRTLDKISLPNTSASQRVLAVRALAHRLSGSVHAGARHGLSTAPWPSPLAPQTRRFIWWARKER